MKRKAWFLLMPAVMAALLLLPRVARGETFLPDDPVTRDPDDQDMPEPREEVIVEEFDFLQNTFSDPGGERSAPACNVNTLGEVPDSSWYTNRHHARPMTVEELLRGPDTGAGPSRELAWRIVSGKSQGISPGFTIVTSTGDRYLVKFDPKSNPEMATGAEIICTKIFHALGYNVPENHVCTVRPQDLEIDPKATYKDFVGKKKPLTRSILDRFLKLAPRNPDGSYRVLASKFLSGKPLGPHRYYGTRPDDGNDIFPHELRRDLRGLGVFAAWLNHDDTRCVNALDMYVTDGGRHFVRHCLIDFGSTLGSGSVFAQKRRPGNEYIFEPRPMLASMATFGLWLRPWVMVKYPDLPSIGRFEADFFDPVKWKPEYPNPAFRRCDAADAFWAARQVMAFTDDEIRAVVSTARYSDPAAERYMAETLIKRRDKIGRAYLLHGGGLDRFRVEVGRVLAFDDLPLRHGIVTVPLSRSISWHEFDNVKGAAVLALGGGALTEPRAEIPASSAPFLEADVLTEGLGTTRVFLRRAAEGFDVVGIRRESARAGEVGKRP